MLSPRIWAIFAYLFTAGKVWVYAQLHGMFGFLEENYLKPATLAEAVGNIERFAFYEEAKKAYCIIATGEKAVYANVMLQKGVVINK